MQNATITLPVDIGDTDVTTDLVLSRQEEYLHRTVYIAADHAIDARNTLTLYRTPPKSTSAYKGNVKVSYKFTEDVEVLSPTGDTITSPMIAEASFSIPVGTSAAKRLEIAQRFGAFALHRAVMAGLIDQQSI